MAKCKFYRFFHFWENAALTILQEFLLEKFLAFDHEWTFTQKLADAHEDLDC